MLESLLVISPDAPMTSISARRSITKANFGRLSATVAMRAQSLRFLMRLTQSTPILSSQPMTSALQSPTKV